MPLDLVQIDLKNAWDTLGEITGESAPDELITQLFSQFCLGKQDENENVRIKRV